MAVRLRLTVLLAVALILSLFVVLSIPTDAKAASRTCKRLEAQLASVSSGGSGSNRSVAKAIRGQHKQIRLAKIKLKQLGCSKRRLFFFRDTHPSCGRMRGALQRMRNNLALLKSRRGSGGARSAKKQRAKIRRALRRNRCGVTRTARLPANKRDSGRKSIVDQIFGKKSKKRRRKTALADVDQTARRLRNVNTVRTLCVRTCDGYYFPVSFSTNRGSAGGDANACNNLCPGTDMQLHYHKTTGETPEQMVSLTTGKPYSSLPNAFAYRKAFNPNCSCNFRQSTKINQTIAGDEQQKIFEVQTARRAVQKTAMPIWRPDGTADPETAANRRGKLNLAALGAPNTKRPFDQVSQRNVRVVGETFLPAQ